MDTKQAKDFLVQQTVEQGALENVPLTDLEKRMMYFAESDPSSCENPNELNDEFEAQCDTREYEVKISQLLHHAYKRLKHEKDANLRNWDAAVRTLRKGDHYILVLLDVRSESPQQGPRIGLAVAWGCGLSVALVILMMLGVILDHYGLFPRKLFASILDTAFGWVSDDPFARRLQFYFLTFLVLGLWFVIRLAKLGVLRDVFRGMRNGGKASLLTKNRPRSRS